PGDIPVPDIVMDGLKMPDAFARLDVQGENAASEEVVARMEATVIVVRRGLSAEVYDTTLRIGRYRGPGRCVPHRLPGVVVPGFVAELSGPRNRPEPPLEVAGAGIECQDITANVLH